MCHRHKRRQADGGQERHELAKTSRTWSGADGGLSDLELIENCRRLATPKAGHTLDVKDQKGNNPRYGSSWVLW